MNRLVYPVVAIAAAILWPSLAAADCKVPGGQYTEAELAELVACIRRDGRSEDDARNEMNARLMDLYKLVDGADEKRLDDSQRAWIAAAETACPDQTSDGSITVEALACRTARYDQRSAVFDEIIAGCKAGTCPVDKL
jgi:uncharacterized protein YecT (DUF1311 family)